MELTLQLVRDHIKLIEVGVRRRPSRRGQVNPPTAFPGPEEGLVGAMQRRGFLQVMLQGIDLVAGRRFPAGPKDTPPSHGASVVAHDCADLTRSAGTQELCHIAVGDRRSRRHEVHHRKNRRHILHPHVFRVTAGVSRPKTVGPSR